MMSRFTVAAFLFLALQIPLLAQNGGPAPTEAPAGFDTPTLVSG